VVNLVSNHELRQVKKLDTVVLGFERLAETIALTLNILVPMGGSSEDPRG